MKHFLCGVVLALVIGGSLGCSARARHVVVVSTQSVTEILDAVSVLEQQALCQRDICIEIDAQGNKHQYMTPICAGVGAASLCWSVEKSQAFNRKMEIAAKAALEFNRVLSIWEPGMAPPARVHELIVQLGASLTQITLDFPDGSAKSAVLAGIGRAQAMVLQAIDLYFTSVSEPELGSKLSITGK